LIRTSRITDGATSKIMVIAPRESSGRVRVVAGARPGPAAPTPVPALRRPVDADELDICYLPFGPVGVVAIT
jgi:hypothetical protein